MPVNCELRGIIEQSSQEERKRKKGVDGSFVVSLRAASCYHSLFSLIGLCILAVVMW